MTTTDRFARNAAQVFARAGGDPDHSDALAAWGRAAAKIPDTDPDVTNRGVIVTRDGRLLAETTHIGGAVSAGAHYVARILDKDAASQKEREVGLALGALRRAIGTDVLHVRHWQVCSSMGGR